MRSSLSLCALLTSSVSIASLKQWVRDVARSDVAISDVAVTDVAISDVAISDVAVTGGEFSEQYDLKLFNLTDEFLQFVEQERHHIDCLLLENAPDLPDLFIRLQQQSTLLPAVILMPDSALKEETEEKLGGAISTMAESEQLTLDVYQRVALRFSIGRLGQLDQAIHQAVRQFLDMATPDQILACDLQPGTSEVIVQVAHNLLLQQRRLFEKLKERLGYLGVYYKRDSKNFLRHLPRPQQRALLEQLKSEYRAIVLTYFSNEAGLNDKIDNFVNIAFFADIAVSKIVEVHMEIIDEFSKQLKLEGRSDEVLLDYRLTLIDTIAHLCEMYRRSISKEPFRND